MQRYNAHRERIIATSENADVPPCDTLGVTNVLDHSYCCIEVNQNEEILDSTLINEQQNVSGIDCSQSTFNVEQKQNFDQEAMLNEIQSLRNEKHSLEL